MGYKLAPSDVIERGQRIRSEHLTEFEPVLKQVRQSGAHLGAERAMNRRTTQVAVDDDGAAAGKRGEACDRDRELIPSLSGLGRCDQNGPSKIAWRHEARQDASNRLGELRLRVVDHLRV